MFHKRERRSRCTPETECNTEVETVIPIRLDELVEEFFLQTRRLLVVGEINEISSTHICSYLQLFSLGKEPIYMYINSPGGCAASGYAIIDQMLSCRCPIYTIVRGQGYSMGAIIAAFGTPGHRCATPNSSLMLHSLILQNAPEAIEQHNRMAKHLTQDYLKKVAALAKRMKVTTKQLTELMNETEWMSPKQAIKIGLIDKIWTPSMERSVSRSRKS